MVCEREGGREVKGMESQRVIVVVEETEASRTALKWAIRNFIRAGDSITLLHVYPSTGSKKRQKSLRLMGFQLALSFKELCNGIPEVKVEILVKEGELAPILVSLVKKIEASTLVVDQRFLCKTSISRLISHSLKCRILAVTEHCTDRDCFINAGLSQVLITTLSKSHIHSVQCGRNDEVKNERNMFSSNFGRLWTLRKLKKWSSLDALISDNHCCSLYQDDK